MKKKGDVWFSLFQKFRLLTARTLQPIFDCNIPKFKIKHRQFRKGKITLASELVLFLFSNKLVAFLGHPVQTLMLEISAIENLFKIGVRPVLELY